MGEQEAARHVDGARREQLSFEPRRIRDAPQFLGCGKYGLFNGNGVTHHSKIA